MKIGFDIDGVILDIDLGLIRLIDHESDKKKQADMYKFYYCKRTIQLNPLDFTHEDDELFLITGRNDDFRNVTVAWARKYFPLAQLVILNHKNPSHDVDINKWILQQALVKSKALKKLKIDVYFEDTPEVVRKLRELCPDIKIIQYGGRFSG